MKPCKACGNQIAKGVKKCPQCGKDQRGWAARHKFLTGLGVIVVLAILIGATSGGGSDTVAADASASSAPAEPPVVVTADKLIGDLQGNALQASETYKGKRVEVTGEVSNIDSAGKYFNVNGGSNDYSLVNVQASIEPSQLDQVKAFSKGETVTFVGKVQDVGEVMGYSIDVESIK